MKLYTISNVVTQDPPFFFLARNDAVANRSASQAIEKAPYKPEFRLHLLGHQVDPDRAPLKITLLDMPVEIPITNEPSDLFNEEQNYHGE